MKAAPTMKEFALDPATLPEAEIIALAQKGLLLRVERDTSENGVPAFMTRDDWDAMEARYLHQKGAPGDFLPAVERAIHRLLGHAAETLASRPAGTISATLSATTDLFEDNGQTYLSFVRDTTYPVACVIIGRRPWTGNSAS